MTAIPTPEEQALATPDEARLWYHLGRSAMYAAIARDEIPVLRIGRRVLIPVAAARRQLGLDPQPIRDDASGGQPEANVISISGGTRHVQPYPAG